MARVLSFSSLRANQSIRPLRKNPSAGARVSLPLRYARPRTEACRASLLQITESSTHHGNFVALHAAPVRRYGKFKLFPARRCGRPGPSWPHSARCYGTDRLSALFDLNLTPWEISHTGHSNIRRSWWGSSADEVERATFFARTVGTRAC